MPEHTKLLFYVLQWQCINHCIINYTQQSTYVRRHFAVGEMLMKRSVIYVITKRT